MYEHIQNYIYKSSFIIIYVLGITILDNIWFIFDFAQFLKFLIINNFF